MSKVEFCGKYTKTKSCFWSKSSGISLIVGKRAKPNNSSKTSEFLLFKEPTETKKPHNQEAKKPKHFETKKL